MTRKKITLAYISNDTERKASFKKRKKGLLKKVRELSTLCGVDACAIVYSPYDPQPEVWPSVLGAQEVLARFQNLSEIDQGRKMMNQESYTRHRIQKAEEQVRRLQKENKCRQMENFMFQCLAGVAALEHFDPRDAADMAWAIKQILRDISYRMEMLEKNGFAAPPPGEFVQPPTEPAAGGDEWEGFPWGLVDSPVGFGGECSGGDDVGWVNDNDEMVLPYPFYFNDGEASTSAGAAHEDGNGNGNGGN